ncbi:hypothetical protein pb186bvf_004408 [Paramecium bursaria]
MNQERSYRTISVRYTMVFIITMTSLFVLSQILDNLFYDYTIVETEIVFIKRIDNNFNIDIELNEITESSNSLVLALKSNLKYTIDHLQKRIKILYEEEDDVKLQIDNLKYKQSINLMSYSQFLRNANVEPFNTNQDSIYILTISSTQNEQEQSQSNDNHILELTIYYDQGQNFFDIAQAINLNKYWNEYYKANFSHHTFKMAFEDYNQLILLVHSNLSNKDELYQIRELKACNQQQISNIIQFDQPIQQIQIVSKNIVFRQVNDRSLFRVRIINDNLMDEQIIQLDPTIIFEQQSDIIKPLKFHILNDKQDHLLIAVVYIKYYIGINQRYIKDDLFITGKLCKLKDQIWEELYTFLDRNSTQDIQMSQYNTIENQIFIDFCEENNLLTNKTMDDINQTICLQHQELQNVAFRKIQFSQYDNSLYIVSVLLYKLAEAQNQKYKVFLVEWDHLELDLIDNVDQEVVYTDVLKLRMPFLEPNLIFKDFLVSKNSYNNIVVMFLFKGGDIACIQKLQYGEGVLKKTFLVELLDILLTLAFIGFFRFIKRIISRVYQKLIAICRRLL